MGNDAFKRTSYMVHSSHLYMGALGIGWAISFQMGFRIYVAEVIAIFGLVFVRGSFSTLRRHNAARKVLSVYAIWMLGIFLSDIYNETLPIDSIRNLGTPLLGGASLIFCLSALSRNPHSLLTFLVCTAVAKGVLGEPLFGDSLSNLSGGLASLNENSNYFKVRFAPFVTPAILIIACMQARSNMLSAAGLLLSAALAYMALDARAQGLVLFIASLCLTAIHYGVRPKLKQTLTVGALATIAAYFAYLGYVSYTLQYNASGHSGYQLSRLENPYNPISLLLAGRTEWLVIPEAVAERPLLGWGSWARDVDNRFQVLRHVLLSEISSTSPLRDLDEGYIPVHSLIGAAFVWSGALGLIAIAWLAKIIATMFGQQLLYRTYLTPAVTFYSLMIGWHLLFSPPQHVRITFPVALAALIIAASPPNSKNARSVGSYSPGFRR